MDEIESHFNPPSSSVTPTTKETVPEASIERKMDAVASSNPTAKKPGTIGSKFSTAHNTYFLDEDLDMGADIDNLDNVGRIRSPCLWTVSALGPGKWHSGDHREGGVRLPLLRSAVGKHSAGYLWRDR